MHVCLLNLIVTTKPAKGGRGEECFKFIFSHANGSWLNVDGQMHTTQYMPVLTCTNTHLRLHIDITHVLSSYGSVLQKDILGVPDHDAQYIPFWFARGDVNRGRELLIIRKDVYPHVQLALCM